MREMRWQMVSAYRNHLSENVGRRVLNKYQAQSVILMSDQRHWSAYAMSAILELMAGGASYAVPQVCTKTSYGHQSQTVTRYI